MRVYRQLSTIVIAMLAGTAQAQSGVTLYGIADGGIEYRSNVPAAYADPQNPGTGSGGSLVRVTSGSVAPSRWGLRGVEDLGGSLKALFELESGIWLETGKTYNKTRLFDRAAYVGLSHAFGTIMLGRQTTPLHETTIKFDPMGYAPHYSILGSDAMLGARSDNALKYRGQFGTVTAVAMYSTGRSGVEVPGNYTIDRNFGAALTHESGALALGAGYDEFQGATTATADNKSRRAMVAASYAFGPTQAFAGYRWYNGNAGDMPANRTNLYWAGVRHSATAAVKLTGVAYYTDTIGSNADPVVFVAQADYIFSKRTDIYMNVGYALNRGGSELSLVGYNPVPATPTLVMPGKDQLGITAGLRHRF